METYVTAQQVAKMFRVGVPTVRRYIRSGELPASRVGRSLVVSGDDIDKFVAARKTADVGSEREVREHRGGHRRTRSRKES